MTLEQAKSLKEGTKVRITEFVPGHPMEGVFYKLHSDEVVLLGNGDSKTAYKLEHVEVAAEEPMTEEPIKTETAPTETAVPETDEPPGRPNID